MCSLKWKVSFSHCYAITVGKTEFQIKNKLVKMGM
jgi:hypothetical protein